MPAKTDAQSPQLSRRSFCKTVGFGVGAAAVGSTGSTSALADDDDDDESWLSRATDALRSPTGTFLSATTAQAMGPAYLSAYVGARGADAIVNFDFELWGGDSNQHAKEYLRSDAAHAFRKHRNHTLNTIAQVETIIDYGFDGIFADAKHVGRAAIKDQMTQQEVEDAMVTEASKQVASLQRTLLAAANESVRMFEHYEAQADNADLDTSDLFTNDGSGGLSSVEEREEIELVDGSKADVFQYEGQSGGGSTYTVCAIDEFAREHGGSEITFRARDAKDENDYYNVPNDRRDDDFTLADVWNDLLDAWENDLEPDVKTWAADAYDSVASGDVHVDDLLTSTMVAHTIAEEEPANRAHASLRTAGIPTQPDHPVDLEIDGPQDTTIFAHDVVLGTTDESGAIEQGDIVDPDSIENEWYMNYFIGDLEIEWPHYETQIDGGTLTLTELPDQEFEHYITGDMMMVVETNYDETASFEVFEEFSRTDEEPFEVGIADQLEQSIAEVESITMYSTHAGESDRNRVLTRDFEVVEIEDAQSLDFEHDREVQTADNFITQEEWDEYAEEQQEILDALEDLDSGGTGIGWPDFGETGGLIGGVIVLVGGLWALTAFGGSD